MPCSPYRSFAVIAVTALIAATLVGQAATADRVAAQPAATAGQSDVNGDGYDDLIVGAPGEQIGDAISAGGVTVIFGAPDGIATEGNQSFTQSSAGIPGASEYRDLWGSVTAVGDFDGDGYADVAVGAPGENIANARDTGAVTILAGTSAGVTAAGSRVIHQNTSGIPGANETNDRWGEALAVGDFDADGYDDLVVGVPSEDLGETNDAGAVIVIYGSSSGLDTETAAAFSQRTTSVPGAAEANDQFGATVAAGDIDGDGDDDLVVGAPGESIGAVRSSGMIVTLMGSPNGLTSTGSSALHQGTKRVRGAVEADDRWGAALVVADFDGDGFADAVAGAPGEAIGSISNAGALTLLFGGPGGLSGDGSVALHQGSAGIAGGNERGDRWASVLAAGDITGDGRADLFVGAPEEAVGSLQQAGAAAVLLGGTGGLDGHRSRVFHQGSAGVPGGVEAADHFADAAVVIDLTGDGRSEVVVATSSESLGSDFDTGQVTVFRGASGGLGSAFMLHQDQPGVPGENQTIDYWGRLGTTSRLDLERPAEALLTPRGVYVPVLANTNNGALVRTPCGRAVEVVGGERIGNIQVVVDAGHGGAPDPGAVTQGFVERELNQSIAEALLVDLEGRGIVAILSRTGNYTVPLSSRGALADGLQVDAMVSIHHNSPASAPSSDPGTETYIQSDSELSRRLGGLVQESVYNRLDRFNVAWTSRFDAGVVRVLSSRGTDAYGMMSRPKTPTALVELTYMANPSEAALIRSSAYEPAMAKALGDAIEQYLTTSDEGSGFVNRARTFNPSFAPGFDSCTDPAL